MLPRAQRLLLQRDFAKVYARRRSFALPLAVLYVRGGREGPSRFGFVAGKKVGKAARRNRARRRLREACRALLSRLKPGLDMVVVARSGSAEASYQQLSETLERLLDMAQAKTDGAATA